MSFAIISVASGGGSGSSLTWLWILIAAVAVIGVVVLVLVRRRFGPYTGPDSVVIGGWLSGAIQAIEQGSALGQAISAALRPEAEAAGTSGARWPEIQRRADDLARALDALRKAAAESEDRARPSKRSGTCGHCGSRSTSSRTRTVPARTRLRPFAPGWPRSRRRCATSARPRSTFGERAVSRPWTSRAQATQPGSSLSRSGV